MPNRPTRSSRMSSLQPGSRSSRVPASREFEGGAGRQGSSATAGEPNPHPAALPPTSPASGEVNSPWMPLPGFAADLPSEWGGEARLGFQLDENCFHDGAETLVGR